MPRDLSIADGLSPERRVFAKSLPVVMGPCFRTRACTYLVRRIDSGPERGIPESGIGVIPIAALQIWTGVPRCCHELTGRWAGSGIVVLIKGGGARRTHGCGQNGLPAAAFQG